MVKIKVSSVKEIIFSLLPSQVHSGNLLDFVIKTISINILTYIYIYI